MSRDRDGGSYKKGSGGGMFPSNMQDARRNDEKRLRGLYSKLIKLILTVN